jgi:hypothetical protein
MYGYKTIGLSPDTSFSPDLNDEALGFCVITTLLSCRSQAINHYYSLGNMRYTSNKIIFKVSQTPPKTNPA